jgi:hypothetical protein
MITAFRVLWKTIKDIWEDMLLLVLMNIFTIVCGIPLFAAIGIPIYLGVVAPADQPSPLISLLMVALVASIPASLPYAGALFALYAVCNRIANGFAISWEFYFTNFKQHFLKTWPFLILSNSVSLLILINFLWYPQAFPTQEWVGWVMGAWMAAFLFWSAIQFYAIPFYIEQETKSWKVALKNAALVAGANPLFTLVLFVVATLLILVSTLLIPPLFVLIGLVFWVMIGTQAVINRITMYRTRMEEQQTANPKKR